MKKVMKRAIGYMLSLALAMSVLAPVTAMAEVVTADTYRLVNVATTAKITCDGTTGTTGEIYDLIDTVPADEFSAVKSVFVRGGVTQILFDLGNPQCVTKIDLINQFRQSEYSLQGSNNAVDYTELAKITADTGTELGTDNHGNKAVSNSISFTNTTAYRYYRIYCKTASVFSFSEVKLWANVLVLPKGAEEVSVVSSAEKPISVYGNDGKEYEINSIPANSLTAITDGKNDTCIWDNNTVATVTNNRGYILYDLGKLVNVSGVRCIYPGRSADFSILASADGESYDWIYKATTQGPNDTPDDTGIINVPNKNYRFFKFTRTGNTSTIRRISEFEVYAVDYPDGWWKTLDEGYSWSSSVISGKSPSYQSAGTVAMALSNMTDGKWEETYRGVLNASNTGENAWVTWDLGYKQLIGGTKMTYEYRDTAGKLTLYGSTDNSSWAQLYAFGADATLTNKTAYTEEEYFIPGKYRYIKLAAEKAGVLNVWEIEVYGINEPEKTYNLANSTVQSYIEAAKKAYVTEEYADYTTSIIGNYATVKADKANPATLEWEEIGGAQSYTLSVSASDDFTADETYTYSGLTATSYDVYNLKTNSKYYWKVESDNGVVIGPVAFNTADTVRYINVEKSRNIRDLGGWNGLNQGLVYRGSEINEVEYTDPTTQEAVDHDLGLNAEGIRVFREDLGIKTDLDLRNPNYPYTMGNITESPLGSDIQWINYQASNYTGIFNNGVTKKILSVFADIDNYPIYMHCWGGADRTGSFAFMLQGLNGAAEEDLAIDFELTSFSVFGNRVRYDSGSYTYASMLAKVKAHDGSTLQEKFENCAIETMGLTRAQVSNIQSILSGNGVVYASETADEAATKTMGKSAEFTLANLGQNTVSGVEFGGKAVEYTVSGSTVTAQMPQSLGKGKILFADGNYLTFETKEPAAEIAGTVVNSFENEAALAELGDTDGLKLSIVKDTPDGSAGSMRVIHTTERESRFDMKYKMDKKPENGQKFKLGAWFKMNSEVVDQGNHAWFLLYSDAEVTNVGNSKYSVGDVVACYKTHKLYNVAKVGEWVWAETEELTWSDDGFIYTGGDAEFNAKSTGENLGYGARLTYKGNQNLADTSGELEYYVDNISIIFSEPDNTGSESLLNLGGGATAQNITVNGSITAGETVTLGYDYTKHADATAFTAVEDKDSTKVLVYTTLSDGTKRYYGTYSASDEIPVTTAMAAASEISFEIIPVSTAGVAGSAAVKTVQPGAYTALEKDLELGAVVIRSNEISTAKLISALYTGAKLDSAKGSDITLSDGYKFYQLSADETAAGEQISKYMLWNSFGTMKPICESIK